ncbi:MAG: DUF3857 domain-containing protein, partial [Bacteroidales bacterium]|nr:DUF3857 domain-containing protein [Bacteroidales bacterium]
MKKLITFLFLLSIVLALPAQSLYGKLQPVSKEDLKMETYEKDEEAGAVVLYDFGDSSFEPSTEGFDLKFKKVTRIKILNTAGLDFAEIEIPIYMNGKEKEKVIKLKATTYNLEGETITETQLNISNTYNEKVNEYYEVMKFAMPNVKEGSIIEYSYTLISPYFYNLQDWNFQWRIPVKHSEYQVKLVPYYTYKWLLQGAIKFDWQKSIPASGLEKNIHGIKYKEMIHSYVMKDVPAFRDEQFITTVDDYRIKMEWQLIKYANIRGIETNYRSTWEKIIEDYLKSNNLGKFVKKATKNAAKMIDVGAIRQMDERDRINAVISYVKENYSWNEVHTKYALKSFKELQKEKTGSVGDLNLLTIGLLNAVGIDAKPMISSTRQHGKIYYEYAYTHFFNYTLIYAPIGEEYILLDATDSYLSNFSIPD